MYHLRVIIAALGLLVAGSAAAQDQSPAALPPGMSQQQFDALVDAISKSVTERLKAEGVTAAPASSPPAAPATPPSKSTKPAKAPDKPLIIKTPIQDKPDPVAVFLEDGDRVLMNVPALGHRLALLPGVLDERATGGRGPASILLILGAVSIVAVLLEATLRALLRRWRTRVSTGAVPQRGVRSIGNVIALAALDGLGVLAVWFICHAALGAWFTGRSPQDRFAAALLMAIVSWRISVLLFRIVLQPDMPAARLCEVEDRPARGMYVRISVVLLLAVLAHLFYQVIEAMGAPVGELSAFRMLSPVVYVAALLWLVFGSKEAARQWFKGLRKIAPLIGKLGEYWVPVATTFFVALGVTQVYAVVSGHLHVGEAMMLTLTLVVGVLMFETLMQAVVRRLDSQLEGATPAGDRPRLPDVVARCIRVFVLIAAAVTIAQTWVVDVLALASESEWTQLTLSSRTAAITLFLAYVMWELFRYATEPYMEHKTKDAAQAIADGDPAKGPASRISTLMPMLRVTGAVVIAVIAVMIALDDFGINITPLIAGASVFGIAISFGSQSLVRDIVSGIFYLTDDAFRVGEFIDCGKAKGTVEGFTLRSIRLRHQNGQVFTVPFGQLGSITNFSRDWTTVKFNMRFARDTDLEKLRKAAKRIGTDMLELPEIKAEVLEPFKMQGVADIDDNALIVRFKYTARPGNPASIQREAVNRMFKVFPEEGIQFASGSAAVVLHTTGGGVETGPPPAVPTAPAADQPAGPTAVAAAS
ncbi:MAG: mechanosensitive ion channel family protein [Alphaproteobacteria bacterium]|nr:mechanosensitive ion channel family protein [Alphaproteobacteria bacterium]